jgi:hypothetical protein
MMKQRAEALYVVETIRAFLDGTGGDWDWDDFISCSLRDPGLDRIRVRAGAVDLPLDRAGRSDLEALLKEAERLAEG